MERQTFDQLKSFFSFLLEKHSFHEIDEVYDEKLGYAFVILASDDFHLRLNLDRGQAFVDIASPGGLGEWFDLNMLRCLLLGVDVLQVATPDECAIFAEQNYGQLKALLSQENSQSTATHLKMLEQERAKKLFPKAFERAK